VLQVNGLIIDRQATADQDRRDISKALARGRGSGDRDISRGVVRHKRGDWTLASEEP
jgi:hypothetical protein